MPRERFQLERRMLLQEHRMDGVSQQEPVPIRRRHPPYQGLEREVLALQNPTCWDFFSLARWILSRVYVSSGLGSR